MYNNLFSLTESSLCPLPTQFWSALSTNNPCTYAIDPYSAKSISTPLVKKSFFSQSHSAHINWLESPYGYPGFIRTISHPALDYSQTSLDHIALILVRLSINNILDINLLNYLISFGITILSAGNEVFVFSKEHQGSSSIDLMTSKRRSKLRKAERNLYVKEYSITDLLARPIVLNQIKSIYFKHLSRKQASHFYRFEKLWGNNTSILFSFPHKFYIAFSSLHVDDVQGFLLTIGDQDIDIFLSAANNDGRTNEAGTLLRSTCITKSLTSISFNTLNTGGVNALRGGDPSFKRSFGANPIPYKLALWRNESLYGSLLELFNRNYDENFIKFWEST